MATIRDVAIRAGVSTSTVSRVVTGAVPPLAGTSVRDDLIRAQVRRAGIICG